MLQVSGYLNAENRAILLVRINRSKPPVGAGVLVVPSNVCKVQRIYQPLVGWNCQPQYGVRSSHNKVNTLLSPLSPLSPLRRWWLEGTGRKELTGTTLLGEENLVEYSDSFE
jgi:hypothetical protein